MKTHFVQENFYQNACYDTIIQEKYLTPRGTVKVGRQQGTPFVHMRVGLDTGVGGSEFNREGAWRSQRSWKFDFEKMNL